MSKCKRCGKPFEPEYLDALKVFSSMCQVCQVRNLFDWLDMPSPPELLDRHTKHPTLTKNEFVKKIRHEAEKHEDVV